MSLERLFASRFRNLQEILLDLNPGINFISGKNGSGKQTCWKQHIFIFRKIFRTLALDPVIRKVQMIVWCEENLKGQQRWQIGIVRNRNGERDIESMVKPAQGLANSLKYCQLAYLGRNQWICYGGHLILGEDLNWGLFHVEQGFVELWEAANRCLRQRNHVLEKVIVKAGLLRPGHSSLTFPYSLRKQYLGDYLHLRCG